jgi:DNA-binding LytR/AlgR family response regulator
MPPLKVVICDDEPLAVRRLERMLSSMPEVVVVGTTTDGAEALDLVRSALPDLLLVDIEMPELDGFDVVQALAQVEAPPLVAFVTAFRKFAPQAFETGAIDFLPKPVRLARLDDTVSRARKAIAGREAARRLVELEAMLDNLRASHIPARDEHVWVPRRGEVIRIDLDSVERIVAEGAYVRLHTEDASYLHREPIGAIEKRLDQSRFVRAHRSHIVRIDQVASIKRTMHGGGELILKDGTRVSIGRKYSREARKRLLSADL